MKRFAAVAIAAGLMSTSAWAARATWTGNMEYVTTVTFKSAVRCEYNLYGDTFWQTFRGTTCPYSIEVE